MPKPIRSSASSIRALARCQLARWRPDAAVATSRASAGDVRRDRPSARPAADRRPHDVAGCRVNQTANIVVATAALEVGFNDPHVGAVIQHKAPRGMAAFLQRKGRAGRDTRRCDPLPLPCFRTMAGTEPSIRPMSIVRPALDPAFADPLHNPICPENTGRLRANRLACRPDGGF